YAPEVYEPLSKILQILEKIKKANKKDKKTNADLVDFFELKEMQSTQKLNNSKDFEEIVRRYSEIPKIMVDYAVMEKINHNQVLVIKGEFGWSDVGNWNDLHKKLVTAKDSKGNLTNANWIGIDTTQSLIYANPKKMIATIGVDDMVIVDTKDALLVCPKGRAQDVKKIIEKIKKNKKRREFL
ncbi:MAG: hypothetical protein GF332_02475, partial [Candidatus Moranbacteria bacterium]|nr:hypothetical protein [Candidatus Moranbacteria bacterium]